ncbi:MAG: hypothetical protein AB7O82_20560, partial [Reyranella sp.]
MSAASARALAAVLLSLAAVPAAAQSWNLYSGNSQTVTLPFITPLQPPASPGVFPNLYVTLPGGPTTPVTMDTGSTGMVMSAALIDTTGLQNLGPGSALYSSSNLTFTGTYYQVPTVQISGQAGPSVTANVQVLVVNDSCNPGTRAGCITMMGVGFDRGGNPGVTQPTSAMNAFLNITAIGDTAVSSANMNPGYVVSSSGVTLGLTAAQASGFAMVKLTQNTTIPVNTWNRPKTGLTVAGQQIGTGGFLPDTGIAYMLLTPPANIPTAPAASCPAPSGTCAAHGTNVQVSLIPGLPANVAVGYQFDAVLTPTDDKPAVTPAYVNLRLSPSDNPLSTPVSVNTGNAFYLGFDHLYDPVGGWVGYAAAPGLGGSGSVTPLLAMQGAVDLPSGFGSTLPTYLLADTQLQQTGSGSFSAPLFGLGSNLAVASGSVSFNQAIDMGGGQFSVQSGASAAINASLTASGVVNGGTLTNNGTIQGNITNNGVLSGGGTINGDVINAGTVSPGNSIGTLRIVGNYTHVPQGAHLAEVHLSGLSDKIVVAGRAAIQGPVTVVAQPGTYAPRTTYNLLTAGNGLSGTFSSVSSSAPFLQPSLSYDADNVYLTLTIGGFAAASQTPTQAAVGAALDAGAPGATGDFATILGTLATASSGQVLPFLTSISGQNYSAFSNSMVQGAQLFMNNFALQV